MLPHICRSYGSIVIVHAPENKEKIMERNCVVFILLLMKLKVPRLASCPFFFVYGANYLQVHEALESFMFTGHAKAGVGFMRPLDGRDDKLWATGNWKPRIIVEVW